MKLFKSIKKAFKKVVKGVKKVVKKTVKGIKKVVKKVSSSKILKALAIAAAVVVTGGAAIGAFTGGTATGFAGWMMNASQAVTGGSLFGTSTALARGAGTVAKFVASPFKAVGTALGSAAGNSRSAPDKLLSADKTIATTETANGAGSSVALSVDTLHSAIVTTGNQAFSLANGVNGQIKTISMVTDGGTGTLTPATLAGGTTIAFNDVGDSVILIYNTTGGWAVLSNNGTTIS